MLCVYNQSLVFYEMCFKLFSGLSIPAVVEIVSPMRLFGAAAHIGSGVK